MACLFLKIEAKLEFVLVKVWNVVYDPNKRVVMAT